MCGAALTSRSERDGPRKQVIAMRWTWGREGGREGGRGEEGGEDREGEREGYFVTWGNQLGPTKPRGHRDIEVQKEYVARKEYVAPDEHELTMDSVMG